MLAADLAARHPLGDLKCPLGDLKCCDAGLRPLRAGSPGLQRSNAESSGKGRHTIPEELLRVAGAEGDGGGVRGAFSAEEIKTVGTLGCALVQYCRLDVEDEARSLDEAEHDYFPDQLDKVEDDLRETTEVMELFCAQMSGGDLDVAFS